MEYKNYYGALPSPIDDRDYKAKDYISMGVRPSEYIPQVLCPVHKQTKPMCTGFAMAAAKFYHEQRERKSVLEFSPLYSYFDRLDTDYQGDGRFLRETLSAAQKRGICLQKDIPKDLPYEADYPNIEIKNKLNTVKHLAEEFKISNYARCENMNEVADCVFQHGSALFSLEIRTSFDAFYLKNKNNMILPIPKDSEHVRGYHAVCAMALTKDGIMIQNSWGEHWGYKGFGIIPWDYPVREMWTMVDKKKDWDITELTIGSNIMIINNKEKLLDTAPKIENNRTLVPIRVISEALGADVEYISNERKVIIRKEK